MKRLNNGDIWPVLDASIHKEVVRNAERQDSEEENELMINTFLNPARRTPLVLIESNQVHGGLKNGRG